LAWVIMRHGCASDRSGFLCAALVPQCC
jgi:hypothetical protein